MSVQVSYKKQVALGIMLFLVLIVVIEGIARTYEYYNPHCAMITKDVFSDYDYYFLLTICYDNDRMAYNWSYAPLILLEPNQHFATININSHGFRGPEISLEKPEDTFRIFVVGGSTTYSAGATSDETTIPGYLQKEFDKAGLKVEVINAGIGYAESTTESYYIKNMLVDFNPDLFIIYDGWNDAKRDNVKINENPDKRPFFRFADHTYYRTPFVVHEIPRLIFEGEKREEVNLKYDESISLQRISVWTNNWIETCKFNQEKGIKTIVTVQSILGTGNKPLSPDESKITPKEMTLKTLLGFANSLPSLNSYCDKTADLLNILDDVSEPVYFDRGHMSDFGNKIVAKKLFELSLPLVKIET